MHERQSCQSIAHQTDPSAPNSIVLSSKTLPLHTQKVHTGSLCAVRIWQSQVAFAVTLTQSLVLTESCTLRTTNAACVATAVATATEQQHSCERQVVIACQHLCDVHCMHVLSKAVTRSETATILHSVTQTGTKNALPYNLTKTALSVWPAALAQSAVAC